MKKVFWCVALAVFFQAWPVVYSVYQARSAVLFSQKVNGIPAEGFRKDLFPKITGEYKLEFVFEEKTQTPPVAQFAWKFGSQGKDLAQGQGPAEFKLNNGQIYALTIEPSSFSNLSEKEKQNSFLRLSYDQEALLDLATRRYVEGTVLSLVFAALAFWFWRRSQQNS